MQLRPRRAPGAHFPPRSSPPPPLTSNLSVIGGVQVAEMCVAPSISAMGSAKSHDAIYFDMKLLGAVGRRDATAASTGKSSNLEEGAGARVGARLKRSQASVLAERIDRLVRPAAPGVPSAWMRNAQTRPGRVWPTAESADGAVGVSSIGELCLVERAGRRGPAVAARR